MRKINSKKLLAFSLPLILVAGIFLFGPSVSAEADWAGKLVGGVINIFISALGLILILVIKVLISIAGYQHFIDSQAVVLGWVIVRDICNMFFIVILMIIAFGTILHLENYSYKKWLPKLVLMAILINFSKTICGLLIDVAQVVMITFVNAFKDVGGANMTDILGIDGIVTMAKGNEDLGFWAIVGAYVLGLIYMIVALIVITTMMMILVMRLVMIWIYVVLSPLAYLLSAFPGGEKYALQWWSEFTKNLIIGPVLAFFIWLSFAALQTGNSINTAQLADISGATITDETAEIVESANLDPEDVDAEASEEAKSLALAGTQASTPGALIKFVIAIGMLIGGLKISQDIGGQAGSLAGKGMEALNKGKTLAVSWGKRGLSGDNLLARKFTRAVGADFRPIRLAESWKASTETAKRKDETAIKEKTRRHYEAGGLRSIVLGAGVGEDYFNNYGSIKGISRAGKEVFHNKRKRKHLSKEVDANEEAGKVLKEKRDKLIADKKPEIDKQIQDNLAKDSEYQKYKLSSADSIRLAQIKGKSTLTKAEEEEKNGLEKNKIRADDRAATVKQMTEKKFFESDKEIVDVDVKININKGNLSELKEKMNKVQAPVAFEARSAYRKGIEEAKSKYKSITNSDELQKAYTDATQRGDKFDQVAILEKISGDGNLNEELSSKGYGSNAKGLHAYVHNLENDRGEKKGLSGSFNKQERIQLENDLGELEERVGHWEMAKMCGVNAKGEMESYIKEIKDDKGQTMRDKKGRIMYDDSQHATHAYAEVLKFDPQKIVNSMNRLAMGGEDGSGEFQISNLGKMLYKYLASSGAYEKNTGRIIGNTAANLISGQNLEILKDLMKHDPAKGDLTIKILTEKGSTRDGSNLAGEAYASLKQSNLHF
jgi:hypothetical protein